MGEWQRAYLDPGGCRLSDPVVFEGMLAVTARTAEARAEGPQTVRRFRNTAEMAFARGR
jgi:hypothetical protein